jgi:hypothetical protein
MIYKIEFDIPSDLDMCNISIGVNNDGDIKGEFEYVASICWKDCSPPPHGAELDTINMFKCILEKRGQQDLFTENIKVKLAGYLVLNEGVYFRDDIDENSRVVPLLEY